MQQKWEVGIDEAGRGPLAGPVTVGVVKVPVDFNWDLIPGVNDSKKISEKKREAIFERVKELANKGFLSYSIKSVSAKSIDAKGIVPAIKRAMESAIEELKLSPKEVFIKLDGSLKAPKEYQQETIIKGDMHEKSIGLASILAKVTRDRYMIKIATKYPEYELEQHKGYGTKSHRALISKYGASDIHRTSFCKNCL
jgi:ribonuclease HII